MILHPELASAVRASGPTADRGSAPESKSDLAEAAKQFEGILVRQMLAPLEKSLTAGAGGSNVPMVGGMIMETLSQSIIGGGGLGFSEVIEAALRGAAGGSSDGSTDGKK